MSSGAQKKGWLRVATGLVALTLGVAAPRVYAQVRFGVVDIRRAVSESNEGRAALGALRTRFDERQADLNVRSRTVERLKTRVEHPRGIPPVQLQRMGREYYQRAMELQQLGQQYTEEVQLLESALTKTILVRMQPIVREVGQTDNFQLIVDQQVVHFAPSHLDLTDRVIQLYNQRNPQNGPVTLPSPEQLRAMMGAGGGPGGPGGPGGMGAGPGGALGGGFGGGGGPGGARPGPAPVPAPQSNPPAGAGGGGASAAPPAGGSAAPAAGGERRALPGVFYRADAGT